MSVQSEMALERFLHINNVAAMALQETGCWHPSNGAFQGRKIYQNKIDTSTDTSGVALILQDSLTPLNLNKSVI